jgi:hypothetical protein
MNKNEQYECFVTDNPARLEQHSLRRSVILHLLPGALIVTCYIIAAPQVVNLGFPPGLALLIGFVAVGIPLELGYLLHQGSPGLRRSVCYHSSD